MIDLLRKESFENTNELINCPLCSRRVRNALYVYTHDDRKSRIYRCDFCQFMFLHPLLLDNFSSRHMDSLDDAELFNNKLLKFLHKKLIIDKEIRMVKTKLRKDHFSMFDIGCGTGWTSSIWKEAGAEVTGLEPSLKRAAIAEERYGLKIINSYIEQLNSDVKYDVIVMRHVVEHIDDPLTILKSLRSHLKENGLIVVVVPNIDCIGRFIFGSRWTWVLPLHCDFFSPRSTRYLAEQAGFDVVSLYQTPSPLWYPQSFMRLIPRSENLSKLLYTTLNILSFLPFAPFVLLGYLTGFSDNITVVARMGSESK